jgi:hypothetical protein
MTIIVVGNDLYEVSPVPSSPGWFTGWQQGPQPVILYHQPTGDVTYHYHQTDAARHIQIHQEDK